MKFRRRTYITDTKLQIKFTLVFVIVSFVASIISVAVFNFLAIKRMEALIWSTHLEIQSTGEIVNPLFLYINILNFVFIAALLFIIRIWIIKKTAGPLYRMSKDMKSFVTGNLSVNIILRQKDEFQDTSNELNKMVESIRDRFQVIIEKYGSVSNKVGELNNGVEIVRNSEEVLDNIEGVKRAIACFKV